MSLSSDLISQFVKYTKDETKTKTESIMYGSTVEYNGKTYVKLDGSDLLTPVSTTAATKAGERVTVMIKNHTATITGNLSSPSARTADVEEVGSKISEFEIVMAYKVTTEDLEAVNATIQSLRTKIAHFDNMEAVNAEIAKLEAKFADVDHLSATDVEAINADIENLRATFGDFTDISTEELDAIHADIDVLEGYTADFTYVSADVLQAFKAAIESLETNKLSTESADIRYANIDFANIGEAAITKLFSDSGIIRDIIVSEGKITGELVGVTIKGDLIEGGTVVADKLVVKGEDGIYYKLNFESGTFADGEAVPTDSLHGSVITAKSIVAEKIAVDDLVAFDATIGGFNITDSAIYSGAKASVNNTTTGLYMDKEGQLALGDMNSYIRYYKRDDGSYALEISADDLVFGANKTTVEDTVSGIIKEIEIGTTNLLLGSSNGLGWKHDSFNATDRSFMVQNGDASYSDTVLTIYDSSKLEDTLTLDLSGTGSDTVSDTTLVLSDAGKEVYISNDDVPITLEGAQYYTLSFEVMRDNANRTVDFHIFDADETHTEPIILEQSDILASVGSYERFEYTFLTDARHDESVIFRFDLNAGSGDTTTLKVKSLKLEKGEIATDWSTPPQDIDTSLANVSSDVRTELTDLATRLTQTIEEIRLTAESSYVSNEEYESYKKQLSAELAILADEISMEFNKNLTTSIETVNGDVETRFEELYKHIWFDTDGIHIGDNSGITLNLDNDGIVFSNNGVSFGRWDGKDFYTGNIVVQVNERAQFGNFAFVPRDDDSLSFLKVT